MTTAHRLINLPWWRGDRRQHFRTASPLLVVIAPWRRFEARDWSLGGCLIDTAPGTFKPGDRLEGTIELRGKNERGEFLAEVVRADESGQFGLRWLEVSANMFAEMANVNAPK